MDRNAADIFDVIRNSADLILNEMSQCALSFTDEDGEEVLLNDFDSLAEALKVAENERKIAINLKLPQKDQAGGSKVYGTKRDEKQGKEWQHYFKKFYAKSSDAWTEKMCGHCAIKLTQENVNIFHACLEKKCMHRYFCQSCAQKHPADHVTLKTPHTLKERPEKTAYRAMTVLYPLKASVPRVKLVSQKSKLNGDRLKINFKLKYSGPANSKLQLLFLGSVHEPERAIINLPLLRHKEKFTIECSLKLNKSAVEKSRDSSFFIESEWQLVKLNDDGSKIDLIKLVDSTPILIFGSAPKEEADHKEADFKDMPALTRLEEMAFFASLDNTQKFFLQEVHLGEELLSNGNVEGAVDHFSTAFSVCRAPKELMDVLKQTIPSEAYDLLNQRLAAAKSVVATDHAPKEAETLPHHNNDGASIVLESIALVDRSDGNESLCSLNSDSSFQGVENGDDFAEMFASALLDHDRGSDVTAKGDCDSFVENASLVDGALSENSDAELINVSDMDSIFDVSNVDPAEHIDSVSLPPVTSALPLIMVDQVEQTTEIYTPVSQGNGCQQKNADENSIVSNSENLTQKQSAENDGSFTEKDEIIMERETNFTKKEENLTEKEDLTEKEIFKETETSFAEKLESLTETEEENYFLAQPSVEEPGIKSVPAEKADPLVYESTNNIYEQEIKEAPTASRSESNASINSNDKFAEFLSKLLRSTSHAFENVSVASSQAFAAVNDALEVLQTASGKGASEAPLPKPRVGRAESKQTTTIHDMTTPPSLQHVAWVPKGTQTSWEKGMGDREMSPSVEQEVTLCKSEKDLCEIVKKNRVLNDLGFMDGAKNAQLLIQYNGDLESVVDALLNVEQ